MSPDPTASLPLSHAEERDLARRCASGDRVAEARLIASHLRLVVSMARRYGRFGTPVDDLVQEGTLGLIHAVRKFDPDRDLRLATYAMWWVRAAIQDHVVRSWSLVRVGKTAAHRALFFACKRLAASAAPGGPAMARFTDDMLQRLADRFRLPAAEIGAFVDRIAGRDQSLDAPVDEEGDETGLDRLAVEDRPDPEQAAIDTGMTRRWSGLIDRALSHLPAREAAIIRRRHLGDAAQTFEAIGRELGLSKDRVRQLEKQAIAKLKNSLKPMASAFDLPGRP